ncbi:hypothetical protein [Streptomyces sp. NPDC101115]|uniref:hypothetical protein n=1 Tax=Streptomyces sp. NPDC101115 TaxID=3366106 RepID=UPI00380FAD67
MVSTDGTPEYVPGYVPEYVPDFRPTHVVPRDGLPAWEAPDPTLPTASLDAFLPVQLLERVGDWGQVLCSNGWSAWVDARLLVSVPADPPAAGGPSARTADPRPLIARAEDALGRYRRAAEELAAGRADGETFRQRTRGLRVGMVVDGESVWLYDAEHERWVYCDGVGLRTYAASSGPSAAALTPASGPAPAASAGRPAAAPPPQPGPEAAPQPRSQPQPQREPTPAVEPGHEPTQVVPQLVQDAVRGAGPGEGPGEGPEATRVVTEPPAEERADARADAGAEPPEPDGTGEGR